MSKLDKSYELYIDSFTFFVNVIDYHHQPALGPSADSDRDYIGYDAEVLWDYCYARDSEGDLQYIDIDKYSKQITEKLLDILSELSENNRQEELERVIDMKMY